MNDDIFRHVPPQSFEAEQSVLGAILIEPGPQDDTAARQASILAEITALRVEDFYHEPHREIFRVMHDFAARRIPSDATTLTDGLRARGKLKAIGGPGYILDLARCVPTAANVAHYARIVREKSALRMLASTATEIASMALEAGGAVDVPALLADAEARITAATRIELGDPEPPLDVAMRDLLLAIKRGELAGVSTGFPFLDLALTAGGFERGSLNVLAATTKSGKTALACNIAVRIPRGGTLFISVEMSREQLIRR